MTSGDGSGTLPNRNQDDDDDGSRYAGLNTDDGYVIYDEENHRAWVQSSESLDLSTCN